MLGLLGLWIFEACGADISDLGEEHGHQMLRVTGNGAKVVLTPSHQLWAEPSTTPSEKGTAVPSFGPMLHTLADRARVRLPRMHRHMLRSAAHLRQPDTTQQPVEFVVSMPAFVTVDGATDYANHGEYATAMGGGKIAAQKCVGMPLDSNRVK